jgi:hypothetical protein
MRSAVGPHRSLSGIQIFSLARVRLEPEQVEEEGLEHFVASLSVVVVVVIHD